MRPCLRLVLGLVLAVRSGWCEEPVDDSGVFDDYNQWKQASGAKDATAAGRIAALPEFEVELLRSAGPDEGSWISLTFDPQGRVLVSREDCGILRMTVSEATPGQPAAVTQVETVNDTLHECRGLLWAYDALYANANVDKGLYRLRDADGQGAFEEVELLRATPGGNGHGRNDLVLGPDGCLYLMHGNDVKLPPDHAPAGSAYQRYAIDRPLKCEWNKNLFSYESQPPAGHVIRTDRDGQRWDMVCGGFRNAYGLDFNADGELFTFDADMEWDLGLPWYRPCRVNHVVSGGDYGWRQGVDKWSAWYPDSLPSTLDIGLASPTALRFGTRSNFPQPWRQALFILDWAYGRILAVHLQPRGASYTGKAVSFVRGRPLNVTDLEFGPDGAMYFTTGGRKTQSGLYRVRYTGPAVEQPAPASAAESAAPFAADRALRRKLESLHVSADDIAQVAAALETAWPVLGHRDPWLRHAARVAVEFQPVEHWQERALKETDPDRAGSALLALSRVGSDEGLASLLDALRAWLQKSADFSFTQKLHFLRGAAVAFARHPRPSDEQLAHLAAAVRALLPDDSIEVNQLAFEVLAYCDSGSAPAAGLSLLAQAKSQEEKAHYLYCLRTVRRGWTASERRQFFRALGEAHQFDGARFVPLSVGFIQQDALSNAPENEREALTPLLTPKTPPANPLPAPRPFVRAWEMDDLAGSLDDVGRGRNFAQGKAMFAAAACVRCHRFGGEGAAVGPDITAVAARFSRRDMLESILFPSKVIDDKYRSIVLETTEGEILTGVASGGDESHLYLVPDPLLPTQVRRIPKAEIATQQFSLVSPMPAGALNTLSKEEILDLLAYLESAGRADHPNFAREP